MDMGQDSFYTQQRLAMVNNQLVARNITDARILAVMKTIPRHLFIPDNVKTYAYEDTALPIGVPGQAWLNKEVEFLSGQGLTIHREPSFAFAIAI